MFRRIRSSILALLLAVGSVMVSAAPEKFDVVVYGGTPAGIAAAVTAARLGHRVALVEYQNHLGGMAASGLGKSDVEHREAIGGLWREFVRRVHDHYVRTYGSDHPNVKLCRDGYYYEPSVAQRIFDQMIAEQPSIKVWCGQRLDRAMRRGATLTGIAIVDRASGEKRELAGASFVDCSYEGDLAAAAGVAYRLGREARSEFNEPHAGVVYMDYEDRTFVSGTTGEGDRRLPAYTYRLCLSKDPENSVLLTAPPPDYDRARYLAYIDDWKAGRFAPPKQMVEGVGNYSPLFNTVVRAFSMADLPNGKLDVNMNPRPLGFPFAGENYDYPEANWERREQIATRIRNLTLGLLWFVQNDPEVPPAQRELARRFSLARDEFTDNENFPWQLYVREARRIIGEYTLSEADVMLPPNAGRARVHSDSIAAGEYPIDSFPVRKREAGHDVALEGYILMLDKVTHPYQIPYRIMVPREVEGLLVPVAASTTHIAFSSIRLEPTWMALGQAAATAVHQALERNISLRRVEIAALQRQLLRDGQVLTFFRDIDPASPAHAAIQFYGTKGFFTDYTANATGTLDRPTARRWLDLAHKEKSVAIAAVIAGDGVVTAKDVSAMAAAAKVSAPAWISGGESAITRGEFCRWLYEAMWK